jgi:uncharacterized protein
VAGWRRRLDLEDQHDVTAPPDAAAKAPPATSRDEVLARIRAVRAELEELGVRSVKLFGSAARDELGPESDIDVLVEFKETPSLRPFIGTLDLLEQTLGRRVDLLTPGALDRRLAERIADDLTDAA